VRLAGHSSQAPAESATSDREIDNAREYHAVEMGHQTFDRFAAYLATQSA